MKKIVIPLILLSASFCYSSSSTFGLMPHVYIASYAVDDYSNYKIKQRIKQRLNSVNHKNMFVNSMFQCVKKKYPNMKTSHTYDRENALATESKYRADNISQSDFVFFSGHGHQQTLAFYDKQIDVSKRLFGGSVRWAILDACLVLNVNKYNSTTSNMLKNDLTIQSIDYAKVDKVRKLFNGVHAVLGHYADGPRRITGNDENDSGVIFREFANSFVINGYSIWDAYRIATGRITFHTYHEGVKPAIAFLRGYDAQGTYHDTSTETFSNVYKAPLKIEGTLELFIMYQNFGVPTFEGL